MPFALFLCNQPLSVALGNSLCKISVAIRTDHVFAHETGGYPVGKRVAVSILRTLFTLLGSWALHSLT